MSESASGVAGPVRRLSWWRRLLLFVLDVNPPWWGRAGTWALLFMLVWLASVVAIVNDAHQGNSWVFTLPFERAGENGWRVADPTRMRFDAQIEIRTNFAFARHWRVAVPGPMRGQIYGPGQPSIPAAEAEARMIVEDAFARLSAEEFMDWAGKAAGLAPGGSRFDRELWKQVVYERRSEAFSGSHFWRWAARQSGWLGRFSLIGFLVCALVGFPRALQRRAYERPLALSIQGRCPRCRYDLRGLPTRVCPECGTDVEAVEREARAALD